MTSQQLEEIRARCEAATPGPWVAEVKTLYGVSVSMPTENRYYDIRTNKHDADFIAHARQDIPDLLDEVERLNIIIQGLESLRPIQLGRVAAAQMIDAIEKGAPK